MDTKIKGYIFFMSLGHLVLLLVLCRSCLQLYTNDAFNGYSTVSQVIQYSEGVSLLQLILQNKIPHILLSGEQPLEIHSIFKGKAAFYSNRIPF